MIEKITDHSLERYDSRLKEWCDRKFFEKGNYGKYETTEEAGVVAFYPAPNTPLEGKVKFSFKETMPADGNKGPDNPSTITGVSSVLVGHCGKNLCPLVLPANSDWMSVRGIQFEYNALDGGFALNGTADSSKNPFLQLFTRNGITDNVSKILKENRTYTFSLFCDSTNVNARLYDVLTYDGFGSGTGIDANTSLTHTMIQNGKGFIFRILVSTGVTINTKAYVQIEESSEATQFEIPSISEQTISLNGTYYGGEIDLATGVMTVTVGFAELTTFGGVDGIGIDTVLFGADHVISHPNGGGGYENSCQELSRVNALSDDLEGYNFWGGAGRETVRIRIAKSRLDVSGAVDSSNPTAAEWLTAGNAWLSQHPLHFASALATPYTVQLSPTQILSLSQFDKYTPRLNTVYTDADSIQISYLKSPIRDEYEKTQAILSLGGNS